MCDFESKSERGLKTNRTRKQEPCDWCEFICKEKNELKEHKMNEHTSEYSAGVFRGYFGKSP